jgi:nucleoside-diphosphate-sugar epimerase|tara:strand:- start:3326 stop:4171 length:846 start_codon:yes stop_codon:yes gene_type:complete
MNKYLVLGSSGQIGAPLVEFLRAHNHEVYTLDIAEDRTEDLRLAHNELLLKYATQADFVFFLAFDVGGAKYLSKYQDTFNFIQNNIQIMSNTFETLRHLKKPFIFASSQMSDMNHSTYGLCKAIGERYTNALGGLNIKLWNVYGYEKDSEKSHVITDFILKASQTGTINMLTDGKEERQLLHAEDCCRALYELSIQFEKIDKTIDYHLTSFVWTTIIEVAHEVASNYKNISIERSVTTDLTHGSWRKEPPEHILQYWSPSITLQEGIKRVIKEIESGLSTK